MPNIDTLDAAALNIISAVVHMDEKTPHLHLCFVPLTRDGRLSAKEILGNKKSMIRWQDDFYACMAERWPNLERGTPAVETKRKHLTPQWYKKVTAMDAKLEQVEEALKSINVLNAGKKREEVIALIAQLLPDVESFQAETQRLLDTIALSQQEWQRQQWKNDALLDELNEERDRNYKQHMGKFPILCKMIGREDLITDPRFATLKDAQANKRELISIFDNWFIQHTWAEVDALLSAGDIAHSKIYHFADVSSDAQARACNYVYDFTTRTGGTDITVSSPIKFGRNDAVEHRNAPLVGEQTEEILREFGYSEQDIRILEEKNIVKQHA